MAPLIVSILLSIVLPLASGTTEDRKAAFRQAVIDRYDETTEIDTCKCAERDNISFPPPTDCGIEEQGSNYIGANAISGSNPGIAVFPFMGLPIPNEDAALDDLLCRVVCDEQTTGDFSLTVVMRTLGHADSTLQTKILTRLQELYDAGDLRLWADTGEDHNMYEIFG